MKFKTSEAIDDRIRALRLEIEAFIELKVQFERERCPGVPPGVIRNILEARSGGCACQTALNIIAEQGS